MTTLTEEEIAYLRSQIKACVKLTIEGGAAVALLHGTEGIKTVYTIKMPLEPLLAMLALRRLAEASWNHCLASEGFERGVGWSLEMRTEAKKELDDAAKDFHRTVVLKDLAIHQAIQAVREVDEAKMFECNCGATGMGMLCTGSCTWSSIQEALKAVEHSFGTIVELPK
jgi:hypothetical protein